jgi:hypothetical protein
MKSKIPIRPYRGRHFLRYSPFEIKMSQVFHLLHGSSNGLLEEEFWWKDIQELKRMAQEEKGR